MFELQLVVRKFWSTIAVGACSLISIAGSNHAFANERHVVWLSSYRTMDQARLGLHDLQLRHPRLLATAVPHIHRVNGANGTWFQLQFGPTRPSIEAAQLCENLRNAGHLFCRSLSPFQLANTTPGTTGKAQLEPLGDNVHWVSTRAFEFVDSQGRRWSAPAGVITDVASIPRPLWSIVGHPLIGSFVTAAIIHDHYIKTKSRSWMDTHDVFYEALIDAGVGKVQALTMWAAVYRFGPRWGKNESDCWGVCATGLFYAESLEVHPIFHEAQFEAIRQSVASGKLKSRQDVQAFVDEQLRDGGSAGDKWSETEALVTGFIFDGGGESDELPRTRSYISRRWPGISWTNVGVAHAVSERIFQIGGAETAKLFSDPDDKAMVVAHLPPGTRSIRLMDECGSNWCRISIGKRSGWIKGGHLELDFDASVIPGQGRQ